MAGPNHQSTLIPRTTRSNVRNGANEVAMASDWSGSGATHTSIKGRNDSGITLHRSKTMSVYGQFMKNH
jgi:hypothetical protein